MKKEHFCRFIARLREQKLSQSRMSENWGWSKSSIKAYEKDRLCDIDYLYALSIETDFDFLELINLRLKSGPLAELGLFKSMGGSSHNKHGYEILDEAMSPLIKAGSFVNTETKTEEFRNGAIYLFKMSGSYTARRVQFALGNSILLTAENPSFETLRVEDKERSQLEVIGRINQVTNPIN